MFAYIIYVNDLRIGSQAVQFIFLKQRILDIHKTFTIDISNFSYAVF